MGRALGYTGARRSVSVTLRRYETGARPIPPVIDRLVDALLLIAKISELPHYWTNEPDRDA